MFMHFPKQQILDSSKLKEFADDNFRFDENGRKFSKRVENTVGKGEIARYEQFLLFPQCCQRTYTRKNLDLLGKGLRSLTFFKHFYSSTKSCSSLLGTYFQSVKTRECVMNFKTSQTKQQTRTLQVGIFITCV